MLVKKAAVRINEETENRPALLVQKASNFESKIHLECGNKKVNAKSIMGMMALGLCEGDEITITAEGTDEEAAVNEISDYITGNK